MIERSVPNAPENESGAAVQFDLVQLSLPPTISTVSQLQNTGIKPCI